MACMYVHSHAGLLTQGIVYEGYEVQFSGITNKKKDIWKLGQITDYILCPVLSLHLAPINTVKRKSKWLLLDH